MRGSLSLIIYILAVCLIFGLFDIKENICEKGCKVDKVGKVVVRVDVDM